MNREKFKIDEIVINEENLKKILSDEEFKKFFIENFNEILDKSNCLNYYIIGELYKNDSDVKTIILKSFPKVLSKINDRNAFMRYMKKEEIIEHAEDFFKKSLYSSSDSSINYLEIIKRLEEYKMHDDKILQLISDNMENIINDSYGFLPDVMNKIANYTNRIMFGKISEERQIKIDKIDMALSKNIEKILSIRLKKNKYWEYTWFKKMREFKNTLREKGKDVFINFPLSTDNRIKDYEKISEELWGKFDVETFCIMRYGGYNREKAYYIANEINNLIEQSEDEITMENIELIGEGNFSETYKIGEYVLKIGTTRKNISIPIHRRILQSIKRKQVILDETNKGSEKNFFIEVQNVVDTNWWKSMSEKEIEEVLYNIYKDMRNSGIFWRDIKKENVGKLIKPNKVSCIILGEVTEYVLPKGEYVVIDTDYIDKGDGPSFFSLQKKFEERYLKENNSYR